MLRPSLPKMRLSRRRLRLNRRSGSSRAGRRPFAAADGVLLPEQTLDVVAQYVLNTPDFASWLAAQAMVGELSRKAKADKLEKLDAEIAEVRKEHNTRLIAAAKAEAAARVKDEIAALEESLKPA